MQLFYRPTNKKKRDRALDKWNGIMQKLLLASDVLLRHLFTFVLVHTGAKQACDLRYG